MTGHADRPLTQTVIADRFGVSLSTVSTWLTRYAPTNSALPFPQPDSPAGVTPYWWPTRWPEIQAWHCEFLALHPRKPWPPEGYLTASGVGVWLRRSGTWVRRARAGELKTQKAPLAPFPKPALAVKRRMVTVALWSADQRGDIEAWHAAYLAALPRNHFTTAAPVPTVPSHPGVPPAVRWVPGGDDAGIYLWAPAFGHWVAIQVDTTSTSVHATEALPLGSTELVPMADVSEAIDFYRDQLPANECPSLDSHRGARGAALAELSEASDLPIYMLPPPGNTG